MSMKLIEAVVTNVLFDKGYIVLLSDDYDGSITLSIKYWLEERLPESRTPVLIGDINLTDNGWRAHRGRFIREHDKRKIA